MPQDKKVVEVYEKDAHESNWSLLKYFKGVKRYKWWVIGFTLGFTVLGYIGFRFILSPMRSKLSANYTFTLPGTTNEDGTIRLVNGQQFSYEDVVNKANLEAVKNSEEKYAKIDLDKIIKNNGIAVKRDITVIESGSGTNKETVKTYTSYGITAKTSLFPSEHIGREFIYDVINYTTVIASKAIDSYSITSYLTSSFDDNLFTKQIDLLEKQYEAIDTQLNNMQTSFGSSAYGNSAHKPLYEIYNDFSSKYYDGTINRVEYLSGELMEKGYVNYTEGEEEEKIEEIQSLCKSYKEKLKDYKKRLEIYETTLRNLIETSSSGDETVSSEILSLNKTITNLKFSIDELTKELNMNGYYENADGEFEFDDTKTNSTIYNLQTKDPSWISDCNKFKEDIKKLESSLKADTGIATNTCRYCFANYQNKVYIQDTGFVAVTGEINPFIGALIGLFGGYILSSLIVAAVYIYKKPVENKKED